MSLQSTMRTPRGWATGVAEGERFPYKPGLPAAAVVRGPGQEPGKAHGARSLRSEAVMGARPDPFRSPNKGTHMALYEHLLIARQDISAPSKAVVELERQLKINEDVLRYITVSVDQFEVSSNKNRREDRPEGERKPEGADEEMAK